MEQWKVIPGYDGVYEASTEGRIRRVKGKGCHGGSVRYLKPHKIKNGYMQQVVFRNKVMHRTGVHNLIAAAFLGPCPEGLEIDHIDLDKSNNKPSNLEYITHAENLRRARALKSWGVKGADHKLTHLVDDDIRAIRASKKSQRDLAKDYHVSQVAIHCIKARKTWTHVE